MDTLLLWIESYGIPAILLLILLEYACFPISSELVLPFAGAFGAGADMPLLLLILYSSVAGLIGTSLTYGIGRYGGSPLLEKIMSRFPSSKKPILSSYRTFGNHGKLAVCLGRVIPLCRTYIAFVAGACNQPYLTYALFSFLGIAIWNTVLLTLGYYFYQYREIFFGYFDRYKIFIFFGGILILLLIFVWRQKEENESPSL